MEDDTLFVAGRQIESPRYASRDISRQGDVFMQTASEKNPHLPYGNNTIFTDFVVEHGIEQLARKGDEQSGLILNSVNKSVIVERKHFFPGMDDEYSPRQRTEHRPRTPKDPKKIITSVGSAAAGFSAIEIITHSELLSTGSALLSAGLVSGFRQVKRLRTRNEAQNKFDSIQKSFQNPEKRIRLANDTQVAVLSAESYEQLLSQKVPTKDYYGTEVAVKDVLEWAMSELKVGSLQIASKDDVFRSKLLEGMGVADFPTVTPELEVDGIVIQPDASIWQLFKVGLDRYNGLTFFNSDTTNQRITSYKGSVHLCAEK